MTIKCKNKTIKEKSNKNNKNIKPKIERLCIKYIQTLKKYFIYIYIIYNLFSFFFINK